MPDEENKKESYTQGNSDRENVILKTFGKKYVKPVKRDMKFSTQKDFVQDEDEMDVITPERYFESEKDDDGNEIGSVDNAIKSFDDAIKSEISRFVNGNFDNIVVLMGAGASIVTNGQEINSQYGKSVKMIAEHVQSILSNKDESVYTLSELCEKCHYIPASQSESDENPSANKENKVEMSSADKKIKKKKL